MKIRYGITLSGDLTGLPELPALSVAELPGNRLIEPGFALPASLRHKDIFISNPEDRRFFGMVREVGLSVRQDFFRLCTRRAAAAAALNARSFALAPELEELDRLRPALGAVCGIAGRYHLPLTLEVRIPGLAPERFHRARHGLLYPVRTMCVLHPHQSGALEAAERFAAACPYDCDMFRVCFDAAAGNYLSGKLLERLLRLLRPAGSAAPTLIFDPGPGADRSVCLELNKLAEAGARE